MRKKIADVVTVGEEKPKKSPGHYSLLAKNLQFYKRQAKELEKRINATKAELLEYIADSISPDERGSSYFKFIYDGKVMFAVRQARKSTSVNMEKCREQFASDILNRIIVPQTVEVLDEEAIVELIKEEVITDKDLEAITDVNTTYAMVFMSEKEVEKLEQGEEGEEDSVS